MILLGILKVKKSFFLILLFFSAELFPLSIKCNNFHQELEKYKAISETDWFSIEKKCKDIVLSTKRIEIPGYPNAFNSSLIKIEEGFLLSFRYQSDLINKPWISYIGVVVLDDQFNLLTKPIILDTRYNDKRTPSQSEDARLFYFNSKIYVIYNDNMEKEFNQYCYRRHMYIAEIEKNGTSFSLKNPLKLIHKNKYTAVSWQKNWSPFVWNQELFLTYSIQPHEILKPDLYTGVCRPICETDCNMKWELGQLRGSSPPILDEGEYFAFFHSSILRDVSPLSKEPRPHYYIGAYCFSSELPFKLTKMTGTPILHHDFYIPLSGEKLVIFPGGCVIDGDKIYMTYGRNDCEIWIATLDKKKLKRTMQPV